MNRFSPRKIALFLFIILSSLSAQQYDIKIWGITVGSASIDQVSDTEVELNLNSLDFLNNIYPIEIKYYSKYTRNDYSAIESRQSIQQGSNNFKYSVKYADELAIYNDKDSLKIINNSYSLLSLLEKIINTPIDSIDTKWFNLENNGVLYKARTLWNDTTTIKIKNDKYLCDNYRIDLKMMNDDNKLFSETDYFNELFFDINSIRQLWVENWQKQRRLVKISVKNTLIHLEIVIKN